MESLLEYLSTILFTIPPTERVCYISLYRIKPINVAIVSWTVISLVTASWSVHKRLDRHQCVQVEKLLKVTSSPHVSTLFPGFW